MNEEDIKVGNIWIEESSSIEHKIFTFYSLSFIVFILFLYLLIKYNNLLLLLLFLTILFVFIAIYLTINIQFPPDLRNDLYAIHYETNVDFTKDMVDYYKIFDKMKKYYENENLIEQQQKYKIKGTILLYNECSKDKIDWVKEQNRKNKLLECKF